MRWLGLLSFIGICFFGCGVRPPLTQFIGSTTMQSTAEAIAMSVEFEISNTNDIPLQLMMYDYTVTVNGKIVHKGKNSAQQTVPRWSITRSFIPVVIRKDEVAAPETVSWQLPGSLGYVPPSAFAETLLSSGIWETAVRIKAHGPVSDSH